MSKSTSLKSRPRSTRTNPKKQNPPPLNIRGVAEGAVHTRAPLSTSFPNDAAYIPVPGTTFGGPNTTEGFGKSPHSPTKKGGRKKNRTNRRKKNTRRIKKRKNTRKY